MIIKPQKHKNTKYTLENKDSIIYVCEIPCFGDLVAE